ncbi:MAG: hypothetical protein MdMp014T_1755 [Treponematales bacterium]
MKKSGLFILGILASALVCGFVLAGCPNDTGTDPASEAYSIVGTWRLWQSKTTEIVFTNYGIYKATIGSIPWSDIYTYSGTTLNLSWYDAYGITHTYSGTAVFSNNGNTLTISGFMERPGINGAYIRQ